MASQHGQKGYEKHVANDDEYDAPQPTASFPWRVPLFGEYRYPDALLGDYVCCLLTEEMNDLWSFFFHCCLSC